MAGWPGVQAELSERGRRRRRRCGGGVQGQVKLGIRVCPPRPWYLPVRGRGRTAVPGGTLTAPAVAIRRRARTPGTAGHAETPSVVRGSHARQTSTTTETGSLSQTAHTATSGLLARRAAAKIAAYDARLSAGALFPLPSGLNPQAAAAEPPGYRIQAPFQSPVARTAKLAGQLLSHPCPAVRHRDTALPAAKQR